MKLGAHSFSLRQLQYAVAVHETLSFRRAAERCHVSQPSLSAQLAELEEALGVVLFERDRRRVLPTGAGLPILERARRMLVAADDLELAAKGAQNALEGRLRLGIIPTISPYFLPSLTPALRRAHPDLSALWIEGKTEDIVRELDDGALDAAVLALEAPIGTLESAVIAVDRFVFASAKHDPLAGRARAVSLDELADADILLLDEGHCFRDQALSFCSRSSARELEFRATSLPTLVQMVASGAGVTLLPELALATETRHAALSIRPLPAPAPGRTIALVWRPRSPIGEALMTLAKTMKDAYPKRAPTKRC
jgi:LysR family hydrogen peroxide-inducible transcriptional activator